MNHLDTKKKILIFIPAYNVEKKIYSVVSRIPKNIFQDNSIEILIINDFSTDNTSNEINRTINDFDYKFERVKSRKFGRKDYFLGLIVAKVVCKDDF